MTIAHHPTDPTLAAFAAGTLDEGRPWWYRTTWSAVPDCRGAVRSFERLWGIALEDGEPVRLEEGALQRALQKFHPTGRWRRASPTMISLRRDRLRCPRIRSGMAPDRFWTAMAPVAVPAAEGTRVFMLKAAPGIRIPHHAHAGLEWTCVLQGAFSHQLGRYGAGDFDEADATIEHQPVVEDGIECICLVALQGQIQLKSWMGRLIQPFIRI